MAQPNLIGVEIAEYALQEKLGSGKFGTVYLAHKKDQTGNPVCVKFCATRSEAVTETTAAKAYYTQIGMEHTDYSVHKTQYGYMCVLPLVKGHTLDRYLKGDNLTPDALYALAISFIKQLLTMKYLQWMARDIHLENAMVHCDADGNPSAVLIDFGFAVNVNTKNAHIPNLAFKSVFNSVLKFSFLSTLVMNQDRFSGHIAPEHRKIEKQSDAGFRSEAYSAGFVLGKLLEAYKVSSHDTLESQQKMDNLAAIATELHNQDPLARPSLEEALTMLSKEAMEEFIANTKCRFPRPATL